MPKIKPKENIMDIVKLCKKVLENKDVENIPIVFVYTVVMCVIEAIGTGECFYETEI